MYSEEINPNRDTLNSKVTKTENAKTPEDSQIPVMPEVPEIPQLPGMPKINEKPQIPNFDLFHEIVKSIEGPEGAESS